MSEAPKPDMRNSLVYLDQHQRARVGVWVPTHTDVTRFPLVQENVAYAA